ncbi:HAD-like domain-containing protein [Mycena olivaceomarginata]|nr:HAD-like domain-containing protein [Mycena olivaceomarginata]
MMGADADCSPVSSHPEDIPHPSSLHPVHDFLRQGADSGPLLPPLQDDISGFKCLVLDLDETLLHSSRIYSQRYDFILVVKSRTFYTMFRPGASDFLRKMSEMYEIVVFTASLRSYANPLLDRLDPHHVIHHRLFRDSCLSSNGGYIKDLSRLGRPLKDVIIVDNCPRAYVLHPNHAIPISSWYKDRLDTELLELSPFLVDLAKVDDVRDVLGSISQQNKDRRFLEQKARFFCGLTYWLFCRFSSLNLFTLGNSGDATRERP